MLFDVDKQIERGATVSDDTLKWWSEQSGRAQEVLNGGTNDPQDFLDACKTDFPDINLNKALWYWSRDTLRHRHHAEPLREIQHESTMALSVAT